LEKLGLDGAEVFQMFIHSSSQSHACLAGLR
jgi:hypothetical protein